MSRPRSTRAAAPSPWAAARALLLSSALVSSCLAAGLLGSCSGGGPGGGGPSDGGGGGGEQGVRAVERTKVVVEQVVRRDLNEELETTAVLEADRQVTVVARQSGQVIEVLAEEGDTVQAGQILALLDDRSERMTLRNAEISVAEAKQALASNEIAIKEAQTSIETAKSQLAQTERDLARDEELFKTGEGSVAAVSAKVLEQSRLARDQAAQDLAQRKLALERAILDRDSGTTAVSRAEVTRDEASLALERMAISAPFDGVVASRTVRLGQNLSAGEEAFVVADPLDLRVVFYRPQRELGMFAARPEGTLTLTARSEALPGVEFSGRVIRIAPNIDAESGSFRLTAAMDRVPVDDGPERLLPGMLLRLRIVTDRRENVLAVKKRAVVREGDQAFVFAVEPDGERFVARRRLVREGFSDATHVQIEALDEPALTDTTRVVLIGARDLTDGDPLEVEER
ncbi:Multidrug resistance protein MdtA precursor [Planctomycetes bacterium Pla163]|uniref:Multidrug resistance protein MdtA n=1 Tax=Rohdeia mirabilis TaxID=2528008 RepID=A0A518D3B5_9BACT|nr:Multidrug resistance protein MdtA precursor [Planctomycetes bacterium Pla163]